MKNKEFVTETGFNGRKLKDLRLLSGRTLEEIASEVDASTATVSLWENGKRRPRPKALRRLAEYFKVSIASFFAILLFVTNANASDLARVAAAHIGRGEEVADNTGQWVERYTRGKRVAWCAGFVSYVLREAGHEVPYTLWARDFARPRVYGDLRGFPGRGNIVVFKRGTKSGHVAIVDQVLDKQHFWIIEGNHGAFPAKVKRSFVDTSKDYGREVIAFVRV